MKMKFHLPSGFKLRIAAVALCFAAPVLFLIGFGAYQLWETGWLFVFWWPMALCFITGYGLMWFWTRRRKTKLMPTGVVDAPSHWTDRDKRAWEIVLEYCNSVPAMSADDLSDMNRYANDAKPLVEKVAQIYRPGAKDPFGHLTLPEILACGELVAADLAQLVDKYVPGSHAISIDNFKRVKQAVDWYERGRNLYWIFSAILDPVRVGAQVLATKAGLQTTLKQVQNNVITWFYTTYLQELGRYLIELNSGRLKVGVARYRELLAKKENIPAEPTAEPTVTVVPDPASTGPKLQTDPDRITIGIVGPVKAGKSSLVNAIFGEQKADVASTPLTLAATRYDLQPTGFAPLSLIDTAGFGFQGAGDADVAAAAEVFAKSDIALLVVPARSAARRPEVEFYERVRGLFAKRPELKLPPVILVLTNIDALTPAMEWAPPYEWKAGTRPKEESIRDAVDAAREQFTTVVDSVPVCTAHGREYAVREELLPLIAAQLDDARGVQFLRMLHAEAEADKTRKVIGQALNAGKEALKLLWQNANKSPRG